MDYVNLYEQIGRVHFRGQSGTEFSASSTRTDKKNKVIADVSKYLLNKPFEVLSQVPEGIEGVALSRDYLKEIVKGLRQKRFCANLPRP